MNLRTILMEKPWVAVKKQRIFKDKFLRWFLVSAVLLCIAVLVLLAFNLRPTGFAVPVEYTSGKEFKLNDWYHIYGYGLFSLMVTSGNITLAALSFEKSRITSFFLVISAIILNVFTLVITYTLLSQVG